MKIAQRKSYEISTNSTISTVFNQNVDWMTINEKDGILYTYVYYRIICWYGWECCVRYGNDANPWIKCSFSWNTVESMNHLKLVTTTVCFGRHNKKVSQSLKRKIFSSSTEFIDFKENNTQKAAKTTPTYIECISSMRAHWTWCKRGQCRSIAFDK